MISENGKANMEPDELLQQKLTQLELGYPLDDALADAPEQEARLLRLAAALQATPFPAEDEAVMAAQRITLLGVAKGLAVKPIPEAQTENTALPTGAAILLLLERAHAGNGRPRRATGTG